MSSSPSSPASPEAPRSQVRFRGRAHATHGRAFDPRRAKREIERERVRLSVLEEFDPLGEVERPRTRGDCVDAERPCPFVGCRYHLFLEVRPNGNIVLRFPDLEPWELTETCALDVATRGGETQENVGALLNITREAVRLNEVAIFGKLRSSALER